MHSNCRCPSCRGREEFQPEYFETDEYGFAFEDEGALMRDPFSFETEAYEAPLQFDFERWELPAEFESDLFGEFESPGGCPPFTPAAMENPGGGRVKNKTAPGAGDLVRVNRAFSGTVPLHRLAAKALDAMQCAARAAGIKPPLLQPTSGFRDPAHQARLWANALKKYGSPEEARKWVAPPGGSAHQSGRAVDLYLGGKNSSSNVANLRKLPAYHWLVANARRFGFYPYEREPWHWEYNPPTSGQSELFEHELFEEEFEDEGIGPVYGEFEEEFEDEWGGITNWLSQWGWPSTSATPPLHDLVRNAPVGDLASDEVTWERLMCMRDFLARGLSGEKVDDRYWTYPYVTFLGQILPCDPLGRKNTQGISFKDKKMKNAIEAFKRKVGESKDKNLIARAIKSIHDDILCQLNELARAIQQALGDAPNRWESQECFEARLLLTISKRPESIIKCFRKFLEQAFSVTCRIPE